MSEPKFERTWTALVTPMDEKGNIDWDGLKKNIEFQLSQGITGILPAGTTGESPTLSWQEHRDIIKKTIAYANKKCGVIAGCGSNSAEEAADIVGYAAGEGADAVLLVDCYYNAPSSLELRKEYYEPIVKEHSGLPVVPYVIPGRTGTALSAEDVALLSWKYPNVCAVKEATGDQERMRRTREFAREDFRILSGDDDITFNIMLDPRIRAEGVISVMSNIIPGSILEMTGAVLEGDDNAAREIQEKIKPLLGLVTVTARNERVLTEGRALFVEDKFRNPVPLKTMMKALGIPSGSCRRPLGKMTAPGVKKVRSALRGVWEKNPCVLRPAVDFYGIDIEKKLGDDSLWDSLAYSD